jgi:pimeloyl-ACP methyl ester carboxylesterase
MRAVDMTVTADDGLLLAGTLMLPEGPGPHPAVLVLNGSGKLDRDGNTRKLRMDLGAPLAAALAQQGIATLRYDRRGVGATPGNWLATGFTDNRRDAEAALRALAARADIGAVGVLGHSEGAVHAMSLGANPQVSAVVLLAGFARRGEDALRWQGTMIARDLPAFVRPLLKAFATRQLARIKKSTKDVARVAGIPVNAKWMREMLVHDSRADLARITAPVLAITGDKDLQVDPADLEEIRRLVPGEVEIHRPADLTHLLRLDPDKPSVRSYRRLLRHPVDAALQAHVTGWLAHRLRKTAQQR